MCYLCVIANMNNMLVACKLCYYMRIWYINMNWYENDISHFICMGTQWSIKCVCIHGFWRNYIGGLPTNIYRSMSTILYRRVVDKTIYRSMSTELYQRVNQ